jgi:hypothetical protein
VLFKSSGTSKLPMVKAVMTKCLNGKKSIIIFKVENSVNFTQQEIKIFQVIESIKPVIAFNNRFDETLVEKINGMGSELEVPSVTKSYFVISVNVKLITKHLKLFSRVNTNGQWIFFMMNLQKTQVENLLKFAYEVHK